MYETYISADKKANAGMGRGRTASYEAEDALTSINLSSEIPKAKDRSATISFGSSIIVASPANVTRKAPIKIEKAHSQRDADRTPTFSEWGSGFKPNQESNDQTK